MTSENYDPGAGLSEASAFEERMNAGWYDEPSDDESEFDRSDPRARVGVVLEFLTPHYGFSVAQVDALEMWACGTPQREVALRAGVKRNALRKWIAKADKIFKDDYDG